MKLLIFRILYYLCAGTFLSFGFVRPRSVGSRYFLYHGLILLAVFGLAVFVGDNYISMFAIASFATSCAVVTFFSIRPIPFWVAYLIGAGTIASTIFSHGIGAIASVLLLGFTMASMLLGHWYLVEPKLSIDELKRLTAFFIASLIARTVSAILPTLDVLSGKSETEIYRYLMGDSAGIFLLMRWCWGLLAPLVLSYLIWNTVKIRSTQSATGILYVAVLCVIAGEILALYLTLFRGIAV